MLRLIIGAFFAYALYINFAGGCATVNQIGCFKSSTTLIIAFVLYLAFGSLFFFKKWFHLFNHRQHYRLKRIKFGFISILLLVAGLGTIIFIGFNIFSQQNYLNLNTDLNAQILKTINGLGK